MAAPYTRLVIYKLVWQILPYLMVLCIKLGPFDRRDHRDAERSRNLSNCQEKVTEVNITGTAGY